MRAPALAAPLLLIASLAHGQAARTATPAVVRTMDSGVPMPPEQAAIDVTSYDLAVRVDPTAKAISGALTMRARTVAPLRRVVLDLDSVYTISATRAADGTPLKFGRQAGGRVWIDLPAPVPANRTVELTVEYAGKPRVAKNPPWDGGFTWAKTADGRPWIGVSCQAEGADLWWPTKDQPSDEPDSVRLNVTVPRGLTVAANGRLRGQQDNADSTTTFNWAVTTPINNYDLTLNIAPYTVFRPDYTNPYGERYPVVFYMLPEHATQAQASIPGFLKHLSFLEQRFGPYPFRADKYGVAETPYLGMEHQSIIAYGDKFKDNEAGFDWLHFHELSHEWWGNLMTARNWKDFWLHEGFAEYSEALYAEHLSGPAAYRAYMAKLRRPIRNDAAIAPRIPRSADQMYSGDIYYKGAWILNTLRGVVGDSAFSRTLRRFAYPTAALEQVTDGGQCRFASTDDFQKLAEQMSGQKLGWFFETYLRQPALPHLTATRTGNRLSLRWTAPGKRPFPLPIDVKIGDQTRRVPMPGGQATLTVPTGAAITLDPDGWVLMDAPTRVGFTDNVPGK